ncbi:MAG: MFS transporter [Patescibacteria group bacterium]
MSAARTYYLFFALIHIGMGLHVTAYTPFLASIGLSLGEIALVNTIFWGVLITAELPTGMLADGRSRAYSLKLGAGISALGALAYVFAIGFWSAAFAEAVLAVGGAFISGAGTAWIADALAREGRGEELRRVYATESLIKSVCFLMGGVAGAVLAVIDYRLIWIGYVVGGACSSFIAHTKMNGRGEPLEYVSEWMAFRLALRALWQSRALIWSVCAILVFDAVIAFNHYWALYFKPEVGQLGLSWIWVVMYLGLLGASQFVRRSSVPQGREASLIAFSLLLAGVGIGLVALAPTLGLAVSAVVVHEVGRGLFEPLSNSFVQSRLHTSYRATFGSLQSLLGRAGLAVIPLIIWLSIEGQPDTPETIAMVWLASAVYLILGATALWFTRTRV